MAVAERGAPAHLDALTGVRGIAAWLVVLYHIRDSLIGILTAPERAALAKGYLAVDLFFVLSGFVMWYNYAPRLREGGLGEAGPFLWRRIARIWPLHVVILALFVLAAQWLVAAGRDATFYPVEELPLHVLLLQNWGFTPDLKWNYPAWSISTEMAAYLVFPLVVLAAKWERLPTAALLLAGLVLLAGIPLYFWVNGETVLGNQIAQLGLLRCLMEFSLGNLVCLLWLRWRDIAHAGKIAVAACAGVVAAAFALPLPETAFVPAAFVTALLALATGRGAIVRMLGGRVMRYLGEISYSTYLAHTLVWMPFKLTFADAWVQISWGELIGFLLLLCAASAFFYHGVEKPAQRWMNGHRPRLPLRERPLPAE